MRIEQIVKAQDQDGVDVWSVTATIQGARFLLTLPIPGDWDTLTRGEKITWTKAYVTDHLTTHNYAHPAEILFPTLGQSEDAKDDFENLPGWASWTGQEAADWIDANVTDLASAKIALRSMARAIVYLRDIVIER